jgi:choline dehydrogenase
MTPRGSKAGRSRTVCHTSAGPRIGRAAPTCFAAPAARCASSAARACIRSRALIEAAVEVGVPEIADPNGASNEGAALANFNMAGRRRRSSAQGYLKPVWNAGGLTVLTGSLAVELVIENGRRRGVRHLVDGVMRETRAETEIVRALGAIDTPRLLTLTGVGDPQDLKRLGLPAKVAAPGVDKNFQDHPLLRAVDVRAKRPLGPLRGSGGGSMVNWRSDASLALPDVHAFPVQGRSEVPRLFENYDLNGDLFAIGAGLMSAQSVGHVRAPCASPSACSRPLSSCSIASASARATGSMPSRCSSSP